MARGFAGTSGSSAAGRPVASVLAGAAEALHLAGQRGAAGPLGVDERDAAAAGLTAELAAQVFSGDEAPSGARSPLRSLSPSRDHIRVASTLDGFLVPRAAFSSAPGARARR